MGYVPKCRTCGHVQFGGGARGVTGSPCDECGGVIAYAKVERYVPTPPEGLERIKRYVDKCDHIGYDHVEIQRVVCDARTITICVRCGREAV